MVGRAAIETALLAALVTGWVCFLLWVGKARAHDWYPIECCHAMDCAPVDQVTMVAGATYEHGVRVEGTPMMVVTTKMGTGIVNPNLPRRASPDNRMHACLRPADHDKGLSRVICIFLPPDT